MSADLYEHDILSWSEHQADLLRRAARGERANDIDWPHVIEEIADVGISELNAVRCLLRQAMIHLIKIHLFPTDTARLHWRQELDAFIDSMMDRYAPSMGRRVDVQTIWDRAKQRATRYFTDNPGIGALSSDCPWTLDDFLTKDQADLIAALFPPGNTGLILAGRKWDPTA
jgi:hypothetical protein